MLIKKIWKRKSDGQLMVTIPKNEGMSNGDYVKIIKVTENDHPPFKR